MLYNVLALGLIALVSRSVRAEDDSDVLVLTSDNFDATIADNERVLVEFYAPWCGHCKALAPEYEAAATKLKEAGSKTVLAKVDATEEGDLASKYGVRGYPTLKYFTGDLESPSDYSGGRTEDTIVSWITKREQPAVTEFASEEDVEAFTKKNDLALIFRVSGDDKVDVVKKFGEAAREFAATGLLTSDANTVTLVRSFDEPTVVFDGDFTVDALTDFVNAERFPLFAEISQNNYRDYVERELPLVWVAVDPSDEDTFAKVSEGVKATSVKFKGKLSFVYIDNNKYASHVTNLGIKNVPGFIVITTTDDKYLFDGDVTSSDDVSAFFAKYDAGELEKFLKTQVAPENNDEPVFVLVGSAFDDVIGGDKDVFVEYYAPWCGHCKKLAPEYELVGEAFVEVDGVVVAKCDATENDTPEDIRGFPTLIFYKAGSKKGEKYQGGRTAGDIIDYIKENASVDVSKAKDLPAEEEDEDEDTTTTGTEGDAKEDL